MSKLGEVAKDYKNSRTKNIADLPEVSVDLEIMDDQFETTDKKTNQPKVVRQKIVTIDGENYRVPIAVLQQLKVLLEDNPGLKKFKVKKSGTDLETRYQVIPIIAVH